MKTQNLEILSPLSGILFRQYKEKIFLPKKSPLFRTLNANILGTTYDRKINELTAFLNTLIKGFQVKVVWSFNIKCIKRLDIPNLMKKWKTTDSSLINYVYFFQNFMLKLKLRKLPTGLHHLTERLGTQNKAGTEHKKVMPFPDQRSFIFKWL